MKNNIAKKIVCIILTILLLLATNVYGADDSFKTKLTASSSNVKRGKNITVTIALKDIAIKSGEKGIGAYTASIEFDSSVLEYVSSKGTSKWDAPLYQNGKITGNTSDGKVVSTAQNIGSITFKVKSTAKLGKTTIKLTNFSGSTAKTDVKANDVSIKITIANQNTTSSKNNNTNTSTSTSNKGNTSTSGSTSQDTNVSTNVVGSENIVANENIIGTENNVITDGNVIQSGNSNVADDQFVSDYVSSGIENSINNSIKPEKKSNAGMYVLITLGVLVILALIILLIRTINLRRNKMRR